MHIKEETPIAEASLVLLRLTDLVVRVLKFKVGQLGNEAKISR